MATPRVHVLATGGLPCGHRASLATTRVAPREGEVYCSLCALARIHRLNAEIARTAAALLGEKHVSP
jgi:hypothetical protein